MSAILADLVTRTPAVIEKAENALPKGFPAKIADTILAGVRISADRLEAESYKLDHMFDPSHQEPDPIANLMREAAAALRTKGVDRG